MPDRLRAITAALGGVCAPFLRRFCAREKASIMRALSLLLATGAAAAMVACGGGSVFPPESGVDRRRRVQAQARVQARVRPKH